MDLHCSQVVWSNSWAIHQENLQPRWEFRYTDYLLVGGFLRIPV